MTDYLYSLSLAQQTKSFFMALGLGFVLGLLYDIFRIIRVAFWKGKISQIISDFLYCVTFAFCSFLFYIMVNEGEFRFYLLIGELLGFSVYYFSLGVLIFSASETIICVFKKIIFKIVNIILNPFRVIYCKVSSLCRKKVKENRKKAKKVKNKSKILLKTNYHMLYNLCVNKHKVVNSDKSGEREV